jgi:hypothetical protein
VRKTPFAALDVIFFRDGDFQQVTDGGGQHVLVGFEVLIVLGKAASVFAMSFATEGFSAMMRVLSYFSISFLTLWGTACAS